MRDALESQRRRRKRLSHWYDVFLDVGLNLIVVWIVLAAALVALVEWFLR